MVKIGFICEGHTEFILLNSSNFQVLLPKYNLEPVGVINANGSGNLLPHNITGFIKSLEAKGAQKILILTDLEKDPCVTETRQRIKPRKEDILVVAKRQIESWFLACDKTLSQLLKKAYHEDYPELETLPFQKINQLKVSHTGRGFGSHTGGKIKLINMLLELGLDIFDAARHSDCKSAEYFENKLLELGK